MLSCYNLFGNVFYYFLFFLEIAETPETRVPGQISEFRKRETLASECKCILIYEAKL